MVKAALRLVFLALLLVWPQTPSLLHAPSHPGERGGCLPLEEAPQEARLVFWQCCVDYKHKCITKRGKILQDKGKHLLSSDSAKRTVCVMLINIVLDGSVMSFISLRGIFLPASCYSIKGICGLLAFFVYPKLFFYRLLLQESCSFLQKSCCFWSHGRAKLWWEHQRS